jgi:hypothetical protein
MAKAEDGRIVSFIRRHPKFSYMAPLVVGGGSALAYGIVNPTSLGTTAMLIPAVGASYPAAAFLASKAYEDRKERLRRVM